MKKENAGMPGKRILVLGCVGSGKSTFSRALHALTGLPLIHLDRIWWRDDRTHITREEFDRELAAILQGDRWILDGDYSRTYEVRFRACDTVIFLDYGPDVCMRGITERLGRERPDIPWSEQELDPELVRQVQTYEEENRPKVLSLLRQYTNKNLFVFRTRQEADAWLKRRQANTFS